MPKSLVARMPAKVALHTGGSATANGASVDLSGVLRAVLVAKAASGTISAGVLTYEKSHDGGSEWVAADCVRAAATDDDQAVVATSSYTGLPLVMKLDTANGKTLFRARISTAFAGGTIDVDAYLVGKN